MADPIITLKVPGKSGNLIIKIPATDDFYSTPVTNVKLGIKPSDIKKCIGKPIIICGQNPEADFTFEYVLPAIKMMSNQIGIMCSFNVLWSSAHSIVISGDLTDDLDSWTITKAS